jgi:hypothetical protein
MGMLDGITGVLSAAGETAVPQEALLGLLKEHGPALEEFAKTLEAQNPGLPLASAQPGQSSAAEVYNDLGRVLDALGKSVPSDGADPAQVEAWGAKLHVVQDLVREVMESQHDAAQHAIENISVAPVAQEYELSVASADTAHTDHPVEIAYADTDAHGSGSDAHSSASDTHHLDDHSAAVSPDAAS